MSFEGGKRSFVIHYQNTSEREKNMATHNSHLTANKFNFKLNTENFARSAARAPILFLVFCIFRLGVGVRTLRESSTSRNLSIVLMQIATPIHPSPNVFKARLSFFCCHCITIDFVKSKSDERCGIWVRCRVRFQGEQSEERNEMLSVRMLLGVLRGLEDFTAIFRG